jgi:hypothetical protein
MIRVYNSYTRMAIESHLVLAQKKKQDKLKQLKTFFMYEMEQVEVILMLIWHYKRSYPVGLAYKDLLDLLTEQSKFIIFKDRTYIIHLLNTLSALGLLDFRPDKSYEITALGIDYYMECQKN